MDCKWLISLYDDNCEKIASQIKFSGYDVKCVGRNDNLKGKKWWESFDFNDCVVFLGSLQFGRDIDNSRGKHNWWPANICNLNFFKYKHYSQFIGEDLLNWPYSITTYSCFKESRDHWFNVYGNSDCIFVRPDSGFKTFTGKVLYKEKDEALNPYEELYGDELVIVSEPQNIIGEYRFIILEGKVLAGSCYRSFKKHHIFNVFNCHNYLMEDLVAFAEKIAKNIPEELYVMDVAQLDNPYSLDRAFKVVELNSFSSSGFYACDMTKVIDPVSEWTVRQWEEYNART